MSWNDDDLHPTLSLYVCTPTVLTRQIVQLRMTGNYQSFFTGQLIAIILFNCCFYFQGTISASTLLGERGAPLPNCHQQFCLGHLTTSLKVLTQRKLSSCNVGWSPQFYLVQRVKYLLSGPVIIVSKVGFWAIKAINFHFIFNCSIKLLKYSTVTARTYNQQPIC